MLNKMKKVFVTLMLSAACFGGVSTVIEHAVEPVAVHAASDLGGIEDMPLLSMSGGVIQLDDLTTGDKDDFFNTVLKEYRAVIMFVSGIGTISMVLFFILNFINLGKSQGNPQERQKAISGLIISGIATAGLGSVSLIVGLFFNAL